MILGFLEDLSLLFLIFLSVVSKTLILFSLSFLLFKKWIQQKKRYYMDFPFLMSLSFFLFALAKFYDLYLYYRMVKGTSLHSLLIVSKIRFILIIVYTAPLFLIMLIIWIEERIRLKILLTLVWIILGLFSIFSSQTYVSLLKTLYVIALPPLFLNALSFAILHHQEKMTQINCFCVSIGWTLYIFSLLFKPLLTQLGQTPWSLTWLSELIDVVFFYIVYYGFSHPSHSRIAKGPSIR